jgi:phosphoserine aminotransferase
MKPTRVPKNPCFSSGPCAKHPEYSVEELKDTPFGRSHRSKSGRAKLAEAIERTRDMLGLPADYLVGIVAGLMFLFGNLSVKYGQPTSLNS